MTAAFLANRRGARWTRVAPSRRAFGHPRCFDETGDLHARARYVH